MVNKYLVIPKQLEESGIRHGGDTDFLSKARGSANRHGPSFGQKICGIADAVENRFYKLFRNSTLILVGASRALIAEEAQEVWSPSITVGEPLDPCCVNTIYPYPANFSPCCSWDFYVKGEFIYLSSKEDADTNPAGFFSFDGSETRWFIQKSPYKPGFRVSAGVDFDSVVLDVSYLRNHAHMISHYQTRPNGGICLGLQAPPFFSQFFFEPKAFFERVKSSLHLNLDILSATLQNPVYMGRRIIMNLKYGILGLWTRKKTRFDCTGFTTPVPLPPVSVTATGVTSNDYKTWAVGPILGFGATALLPCHFQIIASFDLSLQYAELYKVFVDSRFPDYPAFLGAFSFNKRRNLAHLEAFHNGELGLGWGDYFGCNNQYHLNFTVTYNWLYQHIFAYNEPFIATGFDVGHLTSLSFHGFAIGGRVDF